MIFIRIRRDCKSQHILKIMSCLENSNKVFGKNVKSLRQCLSNYNLKQWRFLNLLYFSNIKKSKVNFKK